MPRLSEYTVKQLRGMAAKANIKGRHKMRKAELVVALSGSKQRLDVLSMNVNELMELAARNNISVRPRARKSDIIRAIRGWAVATARFRMPVMTPTETSLRSAVEFSAFNGSANLAFTPLYKGVGALALLALLSAGEPQAVAESLSVLERFRLLRSKHDALPLFYSYAETAECQPIPNEWTHDDVGDVLGWSGHVFLLVRRGSRWTMALAASDLGPFFRASPPYAKDRPHVEPEQRLYQFCASLTTSLQWQDNERVLLQAQSVVAPVWRKQASDIPETTRNALDHYFLSGHTTINQELRARTKNKRTAALRAFFAPNSIFLARLPAGEHIQLYRALHYNAYSEREAAEYVTRIARLWPGDRFSEAGLVSASRSPSFPCRLGFYRSVEHTVYLVIRLAQHGARFFIASQDLIAPTLTCLGGEGEIILPPGSSFLVTERVNYGFMGKTVTLVFVDATIK